MPRGKLRPTLEEVKALLAEDRDFLRPIVEAVLQELLEAEMTEALGAAKGARTPARLGYRSGDYGRTMVTRIGKLELRVPQDRAGRFSTELSSATSARRRRSWRRSPRCTSKACRPARSRRSPSNSAATASRPRAISTINARLDEELARFARRRLDAACPYLILDARYERVREAG